MNKTFSVAGALALVLLTSACSEAPTPIADPVQLELALASIRKEDASTRFQEKIAGADRISSTLMKVEPSRLDPKMASVLLR